MEDQTTANQTEANSRGDERNQHSCRENRKDEEAPFAFLATYTTRLSAAAKARAKNAGQSATKICR